MRSVEATTHLLATLSAFFSPSLDHGAVPSVISPTFDIDGVDDKAMAELAISPTPPSRSKTRIRSFFDVEPNTDLMVIGSSKVMMHVAIKGAFK